MSVNLKALIERLDDTCRNALEGAAGLCHSRTNYSVEIEHVLLKLLEAPDTDFAKILRHFEVNHAKISKDVAAAVEKLKRGNNGGISMSDRIPPWIEEAWVIGSIDYGAARVRSGHLIVALLVTRERASVAQGISKAFNDISVENLRKKLREITHGSSEEREAGVLGEGAAGAAAGGEEGQAGVPKGTKMLDQFTEDLTGKARAGKIDPVLGRDFEIRQVIDILTRRRQNNPILTGEAGVGKTAVVEGFALRIANGDVPDVLKPVAVRGLDMGLLQAGAGIKGEFENRLKGVIDEVKASPHPIILFIDEAHTMIGAGGQAGQNDAANLLKPPLARGELRTIAATTWAEYKKYFEKDAALTRRFQVVKVDEPDEDKGIAMMRGVSDKFEKHHGVRILDEAVEDSVRLSHRYISGRQLPDKSVSVLDTACARVAIGQGATPGPIEDVRKRLAQIALEVGALERETMTGADHKERLGEIKAEKAELDASLKKLNEQWDKEKELVKEIRDVRTKLEALAPGSSRSEGGTRKTGEVRKTGSVRTTGVVPAESKDVEKQRSKLASLEGELAKIQGETPLMQAVVNSQTIAEVISGWTGIPVGKMLTDEINTVLQLKDRLEARVIGQSHALEAISRRIRTARANLTDPRRPIGVFLLVGPSGVGKTETALTLADTLYGGERNLITINMSEYQEAHTVSSLKGSPPGYVGYGEGGVLTEAVRRKPYSVVLLDEVEKAHPDVMELFYQVFDKGMLEDGEGREIDFKNTVILLTSNAATDTMMKLCADPETAPEPEKLVEAIRPELIKIFKPALLGRMVVVPYYPIGDKVMKEIIKLQLSRIGARLAENHGAKFSYDDAVVAEIAARCKEVESGARNVDHILTRTLLPEMSGEFLSRMATGAPVSRVHVSVGDGGAFRYDIV
jgi:type VI secretion system protein VasG